MRQTLLAAILAFFLNASATADNWAHWRGPTGNGAATNANPPTEWSDTKNVKWKVKVPGNGSGSPVIWEDNIFVVTAVGSGDQSAAAAAPQRRPNQPGRRNRSGGRPSAPLTELNFKVLCFDRADGNLKWERTATTATPHQATHSTNGFSSASPCTDGEHVYASFGSRGLYCYTMKGDLVWHRDDFEKMQTRNAFGEGSSPTIEGDKLLLPWDHEGQSALYALNKSTGKTIWKQNRDEPTCWATPLVVEHNGQKQVIMNGQNQARSYDLESGKELWRCGGQTQRPVASPVSANGVVFVGSGHRGSFLGAFRLDGSGNIQGTDTVAWSVDRDTPDIASPLLSEGRLYYHKGKTGILTCLDAATGKPLFSASRIPGVNSTYASPIAAGGHVYLTGRSGTTTVIKDSDKLQIVSSNSVGETVDATPAPVDDELFIRGERHLFCIGL